MDSQPGNSAPQGNIPITYIPGSTPLSAFQKNQNAQNRSVIGAWILYIISLLALLNPITDILVTKFDAPRIIYGLEITTIFGALFVILEGIYRIIPAFFIILITAVFFFLGYLASRGATWPIITGFILYFLDSLLFLFSSSDVWIQLHYGIMFLLLISYFYAIGEDQGR